MMSLGNTMMTRGAQAIFFIWVGSGLFQPQIKRFSWDIFVGQGILKGTG